MHRGPMRAVTQRRTAQCRRPKVKPGRAGRRQRLRRLKRNPRKREQKRKPGHKPLASARRVGLRRKPALRPAQRANIGSRLRAHFADKLNVEIGDYLFRDVPAARRSSQASSTRLAMPASDNFPHARGSYAFLLPTSPSTFSTPS